MSINGGNEDRVLAVGAAQVLDRYGLRPLEVQVLPGGMENWHLQVKTPTGAVVLTMLRKKTEESAGEYVRFLLHLAGAGAPVPRPRPLLSGGWVASYLGLPIIVCDFVPGRSPDPLPPRLVHRAGVVLGQVHHTGPGFESALRPYLRLEADEAELLAALPEGPFRSWAASTYRGTRYVPELRGPRVPVHADLFPDNIVVQDNDSLVFIDWEDGSLDLPVMDVGMAVLGLCCASTFSVQRTRHLLTGYQEGSQTHLDLQVVRDAALYAAVVTALRRYRRHLDGRRVSWRQSHEALQVSAELLRDRWHHVEA